MFDDLFKALGPTYTNLLFVASLATFLGACGVVWNCRLPGPIAMFLIVAFAPVAIGMWGAWEATQIKKPSQHVPENRESNRPWFIPTDTTKPTLIVKPTEDAVWTRTWVGLAGSMPGLLVTLAGIFWRNQTYRSDPPAESDPPELS